MTDHFQSSNTRNIIPSFRPLLFFILLFSFTNSSAQDGFDSLVLGFNTPPASAKPRVWWHWMNGNVTKEGITKDLEWMNRVGIGGMQMFEASLGTPRIVRQPIVFNTPAWKDVVHHTASEVARLGLEWTLSAAGGWSETGGPMVKPEEAMKKLVWSEVIVRGAAPFTGKLPMPPMQNGKFQDAPSGVQEQGFYKDVAVLAYRIPDTGLNIAELHPKLSSSSPVDGVKLTDGRFAISENLKVLPGSSSAFIQFEFEQPFEARAITIAASTKGSGFFPSPATGQVLVSNDGQSFIPVLTFPGSQHRPSPSRTYTFTPTRARFFRIEFKPIQTDGYDIHSGISQLAGPPSPPTEYTIAELQLHQSPRVNQWQDKAAFGLMFEYQSVPTPATSNAIDKKDVIDLTGIMKPDGNLSWTPPPGNWKVLRMGFSLTGQQNGPAPPELTGYEVDKMSADHVISYLDKYLQPYFDAIGSLYGEKGLQYLLLDSWEANLQNWTDDMLEEFSRRNGYDPRPFLPVLTGMVIGSSEISDRFLWDFRNTIADLITEKHYQTISTYLHKKGIGVYGEAIGAALGTMGDGLKSKGLIDIPMGEFWTEQDSKFRLEHPFDILEAASAAHIYNKKIVAAESFTDIKNPFGPPSFLKYMADYYMTLGVNRFVVHTSVHQPLDDKKPGFTLAIFGQHYTRHNTWAEESVAWNTYLARCSYMLQQGKSTSDIAYFIGEDAPSVAPFWEKLVPEVPEGFKFDFVNGEVILEKMSVRNGDLVLPDGVRYKMLVLPAKLIKMSVPLLRKIQELVNAGATILGPKPTAAPGLTNYPNADKEVESMANAIWGATNGTSITFQEYGKGKVFWGKPVIEIMHSLGFPEDMIFTKPAFNTQVNFIHRKTSDADIYFVANQLFRKEKLELKFRVNGKVPVLWNPDNATIEPVSYRVENGVTIVPYNFDEYGSVFVVFHESTSQESFTVPVITVQKKQGITGTWQVTFPNLYKNTTNLKLDALKSWSDLPDSTLRYFSGTASYSKTFQMAKLEPGRKYWLDLGAVKEIAELTLNGKSLGILWKTPFVVDITKFIKAGNNVLEIKVTNLWTNRMQGDKNLPVNQRFTFATNTIFGNSMEPPGIQLIPSGLMGPVNVIITTQ
ncbi:glycosyl hydrolase [Flavihumibacter fluvii]|uniref:glycosyl hydrolase n=1 Tax=Flavihumibacter fluvii TaxID=2838157 RepID=UPI001BDE3A40|nr:glycosyl hydrolase [Flavihumibacter fluvii]ULQ51419.1 glycoside hydrolase [Flavihumibacter fluvii]